MHWILAHMFYTVLAMLVVASVVMFASTYDLPRKRRLVAFIGYGSIIVYLFHMVWTTGNVLPPVVKPPAGPYEVMTCHSARVFNEPGKGDSVIDNDCELLVIEDVK